MMNNIHFLGFEFISDQKLDLHDLQHYEGAFYRKMSKMLKKYKERFSL